MSELRAGVMEVDITPWLGVSLAGHFEERLAEDVDDPLKAKVLVLDDGATRLAMVALDLINIPRVQVQAIRAAVAARSDMPPDHVMVACTHTHTGPTVRDSRTGKSEEAYVQWMVRQVADAVRLAELRLQPARLATGMGQLHGVSFCRRYRMKDGTVVTNPGRGADVVGPVSPIDPQVGVIYVEDLASRPMAVLAQFSLHYVGTDNALHISADYYGHFAQAVRRVLGPGCVPMLMNGTSGQINNIDMSNPRQLHGHRQARQVANALAAEVMRVIATLSPQAECPLGVAWEAVALPRKQASADDVELARRVLALPASEVTPVRFSHVVGQPIPAKLAVTYARSCQAIHERRDELIPTQVQAMRIGQAVWAALPGEIFVEIGLHIKAHAACPQTCVVGLANDSLGYVATDQALLHEGGYETWASIGNPVGAGAQGILQEAALRTIEQVSGRAISTH